MPDVFFMWPSAKSYLIHEKKLAKDLRPFLKRDGIYDDYSIVSLASFRQDCFYLAEIPFGDTQTCCLYTNKKILKELGLEPAKTYNELKAQLPILKAAGKELILMGNEDKWVLPTCLFSTVVGRIAGKNWAYNIKQGKTKFTDEPFLSAVKMIDKMYKDGIISRKSLFTDYDEVAIQFAEEKGAYLIDGDWRCSEFITNKLTNTALISYERQSSDFEVFLFPSLPGEVLAKSNSGTLGCGYGMSSALEEGSKKEEAAWELIKWLSGPTCQQRRLDTAITFPSLITGIDYSSLDFLTASVADFYTLPEDVTPVFSSKFNPNVANVLNDKLYELGMGKVTAMEVCEAVQAAYDAE